MTTRRRGIAATVLLLAASLIAQEPIEQETTTGTMPVAGVTAPGYPPPAVERPMRSPTRVRPQKPRPPEGPRRDLAPGGEFVVVPANAPRPAGPGDFKYFVNRPLGAAAASRSSVGEPSASLNRDVALQTGNWYGAISADSGVTWKHVDPYAKFPPADGGFCCDQLTAFVPSHGITVWVLQYDYSGMTRQNRLRVAVAKNRDDLKAAKFHWLDFTPQSVGFALGTWFDYPHLAWSSSHFYLTSNLFDGGGGGYRGSVVVRVPLTQLRAGGPVNYSFLTTGSAGPATWRLTQGAAGTMYWGAHPSTSSLRIYSWDDTSTTVSWVDRSISSFYVGLMVQRGPDGNNWLAKADTDIQAAWVAKGIIGFAWTSNRGSAFQVPFVRVAQFSEASKTLSSEKSLYNSALAAAYPAVGVNSRGDLGMVMGYGGPAASVTTGATIIDSYQPWTVNQTFHDVATGSNNPASGEWGDYFTVQVNACNPATFVGTGMTHQGGSGDGDEKPFYLWFGREADEKWTTLTVRSTPNANVNIAVDVADRAGAKDGPTNFQRTYSPCQGYTLTAPAQYQHSGSTWVFHYWTLNGTPQPNGQNVLTVDDIGPDADTAVAAYLRRVPGRFTPYGSACKGYSGTPAHAASSVLGFPAIGVVAHYGVSATRPNTAAVMFLGASNTRWPPVNLPYDLGPLGMPGCYVLVSVDGLIGVPTNAGGVAVISVRVPNNRSLVGNKVYTQFAVIDPSSNKLNVVVSNGLESLFGGDV